MIPGATMQTSGFSGFQRKHSGLTLIELLIAIMIGMVVSLAVFAVLSASEGRKRTVTSVNDINQSGNYALFIVEKLLKSGGSTIGGGITFDKGNTYYPFGCVLHAKNASGQVLPRTGALPSPLDGIALTEFRLAPVLIMPSGNTPAISGQASDVLIVMSGNSGRLGGATAFTNWPTNSTLQVPNTWDFVGNDILLVSDGTAIEPCFIEQVAPGSAVGTQATLNLGGAYYAADVNGSQLTSIDKIGGVFNLGNIVTGNPPSFSVFAVGSDNTLFSYDLLQTSASPLVALADGVFEMHALYGVNTAIADPDLNSYTGVVDEWVDPAVATGDFTWANLTAGDSAASARIARIKAVRVAMIMRTSLPEKEEVGPATLTLFKDLPAALQHVRTFTADERRYRYRVVEATIPLRNMLGDKF